MTAAKKTGQAAADGELGGREAAGLELARQLAERALCVPRILSTALTSRVALPAVRP